MHGLFLVVAETDKLQVYQCDHFPPSDEHKLLRGSYILVSPHCFSLTVDSLLLHCSDKIQLDLGSTLVILEAM